jgi:integrase
MESYELGIVWAKNGVDFEGLFKTTVLIGSNIVFSEDKWYCDKLAKRSNEDKSVNTIYFNGIPLKYKNLVKYFILLKLNSRLAIGTTRNYIKALLLLFNFLETKSISIDSINKETASLFKKYLHQATFTTEYKHTMWANLNVFFQDTKTWDGIPSTNYFAGANPFPKHKNKIGKYIPSTVVDQLDVAFRDESIPLYLRVFYWIARSIPSRANEILGMKLDCLKPYGDDWVIFIPTWKQNGGYKEAQIRRIHLRYEGHGKYLIDLIRQQREESELLQDLVSEKEKGYLLAHPSYTYSKKGFNGIGEFICGKNTKILNTKLAALGWTLNRISERYNITDENNDIYHLTSHQLRHNGITDRLYAGFTPIQIALMTDHQSHEMIVSAYNHSQKEKLIEKQKLVHSEQEQKPVYFNGRILNMEDQLETRLLKNIRSHKLNKLGICSDITGCKSKLFECFDCEFFIPDADQLPYYEEQVKVLEDKIGKLTNSPNLKENMLYNLNLHQKIVERIKMNVEEESM